MELCYTKYAALQRSIAKKTTLHCSRLLLLLLLCVARKKKKKKVTAAAVAFFCLVWSCAATQFHEEGDSNCSRLLLSTMELRGNAQLHEESSLCCGAAQLHEEGDGNAAPRRRRRQCSSMKKAMAVQLHEEGDGNAAPRRRR